MKYFLYLTSLILITLSCQQNSYQDVKEEPKPLEIKEKVIETKYGIETEGYVIEKASIRKNQTLGDIFSEQDLSYSLVLRASELDSIFDIRKIKTGQDICYFKTVKDSTSKTEVIVYEINREDYVVFDFRDSLNMYLGKKEKDIRMRYISGKIKNSLWNAMSEISVNPMLSVELSEVYAWSIDFFGLQKGDGFSVIFEESYIDSVFYDIEKIHAIRFDHAGTFFYAYRFNQDDVWSFFDENGNSLRKAFLKAPLKYSRISSRFSNSRLHPVLKIRRPHHGVDYAAPKGTPVHAVGDGKVIKRGWGKGGGRYIKIKHNSVYTTVYMHFSKFGKFKVGDYVKQGDVVGYVGSSGLATGPHLDFRFYMNGKAVDPLKVKSPPVEPIKPENKEAFLEVVKQYQSTLDSLIQQNYTPNTDANI